MKVAFKYIFLDFSILGVIIAMILCRFPKSLTSVLIVLWLAFVIYSNYIVLIKSNDIIANLKSADKRKLFHSQIDTIERCYNAIKFKEEFFDEYDDDNSIGASYDLLMRQMIANIDSATNYIRSYDTVLRPNTEYVNNIAKNSQELVNKLNELCELVTKIDDSTSEVDITYVDDLLSSLRKVVNNEE